MPKTTQNFRVSSYEKELMFEFAENLAERGALVGGKRPNVSNISALLWMLVCNRELAIIDPVSRSELSKTLMTLRNLGSNLNGLMLAYNQGLIFEKFDDGDKFIADLHTQVLAIKSELEVVIRSANGNRKIAIDALFRSANGKVNLEPSDE